MSDPYVPTLSHPNPPVNIQSEITKTLSGSSPEQITVTRRFTKSVSLSGKKGNNTNNGASVFVGFNSTNQPIEIPAGGTVVISSDSRNWDNDLSKLWLRGASGDGVVVEFQEGIQ